MTPATAQPALLVITTASPRMPASSSSGQAAGVITTDTALRRRVWRPAPLARGRGRSQPRPRSPWPMRCAPWRPSLETVQPRAPDTTSAQRRGPVWPSHTRDARFSEENILIYNPRLIFQGNKNNFHTKEDCQQFCSEVVFITKVSEVESTTTSTTTESSSSMESSIATTSLMTSEVDMSVVTATLNMKTNYSECSLPPERGTCSESLTRFHYVPELEKCIPFLFSGCKVKVKQLLLLQRHFVLIALSFFFYREIPIILIQERNVSLSVILRKRTFNFLALEMVTVMKMPARMISTSSIFQSGFLSPLLTTVRQTVSVSLSRSLVKY